MYKDNLQIVQDLRNEIEELKRENKRLKKRYQHLESGSNKSLLNCHTKGKQNFKRYIDTFYRKEMGTGDYIRHIIEKVEPISYIEIIEGEF